MIHIHSAKERNQMDLGRRAEGSTAKRAMIDVQMM